MYNNKYCNCKVVSVTEIDYVFSPWNIPYSIYEDIKGTLYIDTEDSGRDISRLDTTDIKEAKRILEDYLKEIDSLDNEN